MGKNVADANFLEKEVISSVVKEMSIVPGDVFVEVEDKAKSTTALF